MAIGMSVPRSIIKEGPCDKNQLMLVVALTTLLITFYVNVNSSSHLQDHKLASYFLVFIPVTIAGYCFELIHRKGTMHIVPIFVYKSIFNRSKS